MEKKLAVLVINYNGAKFINECLQSLSAQTLQDQDIYFIDSGSTDNSLELAKKFGNVRIIDIGENKGFTGTYNQATEIIKDSGTHYKYFFFINADTFSPSDLTETLVTLIEQNSSIGIITPAAVNTDKTTIDSIGGSYLFLTGTNFGFQNGTKYVKGNNLYSSYWATGCALMIRADLFYKIGKFSDFFMYYEDIDLSWKVLNEGYDLAGTDAGYVIHYGGGSKAPKVLELLNCERNRIYTYANNLPPMLFYIVLPILLAFRILLVLYKTGNSELRKAKIEGLRQGIKGFAKILRLRNESKRKYDFFGKPLNYFKMYRPTKFL